MTEDNQAARRIAVIACTVLLITGVSPLVHAAQADLPPRPSPPTAPAQSNDDGPPPGAQITLQATFDPGWPWDRVHWQDLWTVVEWQSAEGAWHTVEGWQGTLDGVEVGEKGDVSGEKTWWVYEPNLGQGPFRWSVYEGRGGHLIVVSDAFDLPERVDQRSTIEVSLVR
jgi:hypothetical protein